MSIYQFLIAVRTEGANLTNEAGDTTSHLMGMFYRTIRMVENGIKPVYVFDGKPPQMKGGELAKRTERRSEAQTGLQEAQQSGDAENIEKFQRRLVKVTSQHNEDCKELLKLMGIPYITAPCEAEAQCAALCKAGKVYATATEDMDALTFGTTVLLRHMTFSEARKMPIKEFHVAKVLEEMNFTKEQFIDLCILLGCDYCESIRGIGPKTAVTLIEKHKSIEEILKHLDKDKFQVPEDWKFAGARELFIAPEIQNPDEIDLKWLPPQMDALVEFMCTKNGFQEERIRKSAAKLESARTGAVQGRLDSFFGAIPSSSFAQKRKPDEPVKGAKGKAGAKGAAPPAKKANTGKPRK